MDKEIEEQFDQMDRIFRHFLLPKKSSNLNQKAYKNSTPQSHHSKGKNK